MSVVETVVTAVWLMLPAYIPNNVAVLLGGGPPIDAGKTWGGRRILGDGKTWRGSLSGFIAGFLLASVLNFVLSYGPAWLPSFSLVASFTLPFGAILGDIGASFFKRRLGRERGASFPVVDQLDFVLGSLVLTLVFASDWFFDNFTLPVIVAVVLLTPVLHVTTNVLAYKLGLKNEPW